MAFVKEYRNIKDEFQEWEYLTKIGVRNMFGKTIHKWTSEVVVDREKNYFLIPQGLTDINRDDREIYFYVLCLDGVVLNMEVTKEWTGSAWNSTFECHWNVEKIRFPEKWSNKKIDISELVNIIKNAFVVETYSKKFTPERTKALTVNVSALEGNMLERSKE